MNMITRKRIIIALLGLGITCILGVSLYLFLHRAGSLTINTEQGVDILVKTEQGGTFAKIGTERATYESKDFPVTVYVLVEKSGQKTLTGVHLKRGKNPDVQLALAPTIPATKISDGAVLNAFFDGTTVQGIVPGDGTLTSFRTDTFATTRPEFLDLPYMNKVIWYDKDNFIYQTADRSVGQFKQGADLGTGFLAENITGDVVLGSDDEYATDNLVFISDAAQTAGKPLVLMSQSNLFTSENSGTNLQAIKKFDRNTKDNTLFTSEQSIFRVSSRSGGDEEDSKDPAISIVEYDYSGKEKGTYSLDELAPVIRVTKKDKTIYVLTAANLYAIKDGDNKPQTLGLYFGSASDMVLYKDELVILGDEGLWKLDSSDNSLKLLYDYSANGIGLAGSLSVTPDSRLIFGTEPRTDKTDQIGAIFSTSF